MKDGALDADIEGAIGGVIAGCLGGVIWGTGIMPGVGTLTACILEAVQWGFYGAVINSSVYAVRTLWNEYF